MVTATPPVVPNRRAAQFSLVPFERDMPHLKHAGSFGLALRQRLAIAAGYDGAVFVDREGQISEATMGSSRWGGGVSADDMKEMIWTKPALVAQVQFVEWTAENRLRHSKFLGLRSDKAANDVRRET